MIRKLFSDYRLLALILIGGFGVWLIYWDYVDQVNTWLHQNGIPPLLVGILIVAIVGILGYKVIR